MRRPRADQVALRAMTSTARPLAAGLSLSPGLGRRVRHYAKSGIFRRADAASWRPCWKFRRPSGIPAARSGRFTIILDQENASRQAT